MILQSPSLITLRVVVRKILQSLQNLVHQVYETKGGKPKECAGDKNVAAREKHITTEDQGLRR
jgi:hypothetical protein